MYIGAHLGTYMAGGLCVSARMTMTWLERGGGKLLCSRRTELAPGCVTASNKRLSATCAAQWRSWGHKKPKRGPDVVLDYIGGMHNLVGIMLPLQHSPDEGLVSSVAGWMELRQAGMRSISVRHRLTTTVAWRACFQLGQDHQYPRRAAAWCGCARVESAVVGLVQVIWP